MDYNDAYRLADDPTGASRAQLQDAWRLLYSADTPENLPAFMRVAYLDRRDAALQSLAEAIDPPAKLLTTADGQPLFYRRVVAGRLASVRREIAAGLHRDADACDAIGDERNAHGNDRAAQRHYRAADRHRASAADHDAAAAELDRYLAGTSPR